MRERYLEAFDVIRIDCLNGDKYKTGKTTPGRRARPQHLLDAGGPGRHSGGHCDYATLVRKADHVRRRRSVSFRHLWGQTKRDGTDSDTAQAEPNGALRQLSGRNLPLGLPFARSSNQ